MAAAARAGLSGHAEDGVQNPGGYGDAQQVVDEGPEEILPDGAHGAAGKLHGGGDAAHVAGDQRDVSRRQGDVGTAADGDAHVCLRQGRGVVDAVAHHRDALALRLQLFHLRGFMVGHDLGEDGVNAELPRHGLGAAAMVAGEHEHFEAELTQGGNGFAGVRLEGVGDCNDTGSAAVQGDEHRCFAVAGQALCDFFELAQRMFACRMRAWLPISTD